jgi:hypothetical protein
MPVAGVLTVNPRHAIATASLPEQIARQFKRLRAMLGILGKSTGFFVSCIKK